MSGLAPAAQRNRGGRRAWGAILAIAELAVIAAVQACAPPEGRAVEARPPSASQLWRRGPRDSALAVGVACELIRSLSQSSTNECRLEGFRQTTTAYQVRVREVAPRGRPGPDFPLAEVHLTVDGVSATVERMPLF